MKLRWARLAAVAFVCAMLCTALLSARLAIPTGAQTPNIAGATQFLPLVASEPTPAGVYDCNEYEFGLIWTSEVVTLNSDGSSTYAYAPPYTQVVTGTWVYTPTSQEIGFTNFRWITATIVLPDRFFASRYLPQVKFEIGVDCRRRAAPLVDIDTRRQALVAPSSLFRLRCSSTKKTA